MTDDPSRALPLFSMIPLILYGAFLLSCAGALASGLAIGWDLVIDDRHLDLTRDLFRTFLMLGFGLGLVQVPALVLVRDRVPRMPQSFLAMPDRVRKGSFLVYLVALAIVLGHCGGRFPREGVYWTVAVLTVVAGLVFAVSSPMSRAIEPILLRDRNPEGADPP